jgi:hypothetical protein
MIKTRNAILGFLLTVWCSILRGICRWLAVRFYLRTRAIGMDLHDRAVQAHRFDLDADNLLFLSFSRRVGQRFMRV